MSQNEADTGGDSAMDILAILRMLPHRFPFLLVDRVTSCQPGVEIRGYKLITAAEFGRVSMPIALILESLAQISVILTFKSLNVVPTGRELMFFAGIDRADFSGQAAPGDSLHLQASVVRMMPRKGIGKFRTQAFVGQKKIVDAEMMAAMRF